METPKKAKKLTQAFQIRNKAASGTSFHNFFNNNSFKNVLKMITPIL
ncbi:hypothetical protein NC99_25130 [Sunxiuqinia dokdonensis]|uniref:Uncharacterized protein n=1 Tax=Sunxiuqinia dokdonensis TaxID=1409788 RepID=A0A0L8V879_9BACT|nr:hypothetical protein NC99_25130 [Sunxiuqinia dokdonensis]